MKLSKELNDALEAVSKEVDSWPAWKRGIDLYERKKVTEPTGNNEGRTMRDQPTKCSDCGAKPNLRAWKRGRERWFSEIYRRGPSQQLCRRWQCLRCVEREDQSPLDTLEHARKHCVDIMPLHTQKQSRAYLFAMEDFQRAFWEIVQAAKLHNTNTQA